MIAIGIGSNQGDRVENIKKALRLMFSQNLIKSAKISPLYDSEALLPENAPPDWNIPFLNLVVIGQSSLTPHHALKAFKAIETELMRDSSQKWAPRSIDIDILFWNDLELKDDSLEIPHPEFAHRPFALLPLCDLTPYFKPLHSNLDLQELSQKWLIKTPLQTKRSVLPQTRLVGILNVTPDSFSDGGQNLNLPSALKSVEGFVKAGVGIVDLGAESTRPGAQSLTHLEEWSRLKDIFKTIRLEFPQLKISIDTRRPEVSLKALEMGANFINDVSAFEDPRSLEVVKNHECDLIFMHSLGIPPTSQRVLSAKEDIIEALRSWAYKKIELFESHGVSRERLIFDPGIGFGKTVQQNFEILSRIGELRSLGVKILVGHSRKSFLKEMAPESQAFERDPQTACLTFALALQGVDFVRVHNIVMNRLALESSARMGGVRL